MSTTSFDKKSWLPLLALAALAFSPCARAEQLDCSSATKPLHEQIVEKMHADINQKLKERPSKNRDRYFMTVFSYQDTWLNAPEHSHTWATFTHVLPNGKRTGFTISWLPARFRHEQNPRLPVFSDPVVAFAIANKNRCESEAGSNFRLAETLHFGTAIRAKFGVWGPYEVKPEFYALGEKRKAYLDSGATAYKADDRITRPKCGAVNCEHAVSDLAASQIPIGGFMNTGLFQWGFPGTRHVLARMKEKLGPLMIDQMDPKKDVQIYKPVKSLPTQACDSRMIHDGLPSNKTLATGRAPASDKPPRPQAYGLGEE